MPRRRRGAVHLVLRVQREHDVDRARQPRVWPAADAHTLVDSPDMQNFCHVTVIIYPSGVVGPAGLTKAGWVDTIDSRDKAHTVPGTSRL